MIQSPIVTVSNPDADGYHDGTNHALVAWDDYRVAVLFSDLSFSSFAGGSVRMLTVDPATGEIAVGPSTHMYDYGDGDRESTYYTTSQTKVGNLLVQHNSRTGRTFTFTYDEATNTFTRATPQRFDWGGFRDGDNSYDGFGVRLIPWASDTMLVVRKYDVTPFVIGMDTLSHSLVRFAKWNGTSWDLGAYMDVAYGFGDDDYMCIARVMDGTTVKALGQVEKFHLHPPGDNPYYLESTWFYALISGTFPNAPTVDITDQVVTGESDYFPDQWFGSGKTGDRHVLKVVPILSGTTTPIEGGADTFDWGYQLLTVSGGVVTEGPVVSIGPSDDWYDIAMAETPDGHQWATWTLPGTASNGFGGKLGLRDVSDPTAETVIIDEAFDEGIETSDFFTRTMASTSSGVVTAWFTRGESIVRALWAGTPEFVMQGGPRRDARRFW